MAPFCVRSLCLHILNIKISIFKNADEAKSKLRWVKVTYGSIINTTTKVPGPGFG